MRCEGKGKPLVFELTPGEQHESTVFELLMEGGAIKRAGRGRGRPRRLPHRVAADKGYSSKKVRLYLSKRGIGIIIAHKSNEKHRGHFDKELYKQRNRVERLFNRLKQYRRIAHCHSLRETCCQLQGDAHLGGYPPLVVALKTRPNLAHRVSYLIVVLYPSTQPAQACCGITMLYTRPS